MPRLGLGVGLGSVRVPAYVYDADAAAYIAAVEAADGQALETSVKLAYDTFFRGLKTDGDFAKLRAACILGGARSLAGSFVPLLPTMPTPTNFGFVSGDRSRARGLVGNGTSKYLNLNRQSDADPQDSYHQLAWISEINAGASGALGSVLCAGWSNPTSHLIVANSWQFRSRSSGAAITAASNGAGFYGHSRSNATQLSYLLSSGSLVTAALSSVSAASRKTFLLGRNNLDTGDADPTLFGNNRIFFYSVGEGGINLVAVRSRLNTLAAALATL